MDSYAGCEMFYFPRRHGLLLTCVIKSRASQSSAAAMRGKVSIVTLDLWPGSIVDHMCNATAHLSAFPCAVERCGERPHGNAEPRGKRGKTA